MHGSKLGATRPLWSRSIGTGTVSYWAWLNLRRMCASYVSFLQIAQLSYIKRGVYQDIYLVV